MLTVSYPEHQSEEAAEIQTLFVHEDFGRFQNVIIWGQVIFTNSVSWNNTYDIDLYIWFCTADSFFQPQHNYKGQDWNLTGPSFNISMFT